jgi:hypothetical protein
VSILTKSNIKNNLRKVDEFFMFRVMLCIASLIWAALIGIALIPNDNFHLISPAQDLLASVMPSHMWLLLFLIQGVFGFVGLVTATKNKWFVVFDSLLAALLWTTTTSIIMVAYFLLDHNWPPIWSAQITMTIFSVWSLFRNNYGK